MLISLKRKIEFVIKKVEQRPDCIVKIKPLFGLYISVIYPTINRTYYKIQVKKFIQKFKKPLNNSTQQNLSKSSPIVIFKPSWAKYEADMHSNNAETQIKATDAFLAEREKETRSSRVARDWEEGRRKEFQSNKKYYIEDYKRRQQNG